MSSNPKLESGIVKQVNSADSITVRGQPRGGRPKERVLILSSIVAPKLAKRPATNSQNPDETGSKDEPYAWEAREFLRKKLIGKNVSFTAEKLGSTTRECATVYLNKDTPNEEIINETLVKEGYASVRAQSSSRLKELEDQAKSLGKGKYAKSNSEEHQREIIWNLGTDTLNSLLNKYSGKPINAIVEHVRDGSTLRVILSEGNTFYNVTLMIAGIKCPSIRFEDGKTTAADPFADEAQFFVEKNLLQQDIEVTLCGINNNNLIGNVVVPSKGNIAEGLLEEGFAKCVDWTMRLVKNPERLRAAEKRAKEKRQRIWKDYQPPASQAQLSSSEKEFQATVIEILNGDGLIVKLASGTTKKIFLASIRPPRLSGDEKSEGGTGRGKTIRPLYDIPWMFEAREFLRKKLIGKKVNVLVDYIQPARDGFPEKTCCTVTITGGTNVAEAMVSKGLASVVKYRADDDQRSSQYDSLVTAEAKAIKNQKGLHSKKDTPVHRINDYSSDSSKAKNIFPHLKRTSGRTEALVEFVASGSRLRLYIPKESCLITLLLAGISCPRAPRQTPTGTVPVEGEAYGEEALLFTKERCLQREVEITLESVDKAGNFIGWLWIDNVNLSVALVQEGLSRVHFTAERSEYYRFLLDAENSAKAKKLNLWKNHTEEEDKERKQKEEEETVTERKVNHQKVVVIEVTSDLHIFTQLEEQSAKLDALRTKMNHELAGVTIGAYTPRRGDLCAARFKFDNQWYRAKVEKVSGNIIKVFYVDYGNSDEINSTMCAALPAGFENDKYYATEYGLAFVKHPPDLEDQNSALEELRQELLNCSVLLNVEYRVNTLPYVTLYKPEKNEEDIIKTFVEDGFLLIDVRKDRKLKSVVDGYISAQKKAMKEHLQIWQHGDITEDDDKEFGVGRGKF